MAWLARPHVAWWLGCGSTLAALIIAFSVMTPRQPAPVNVLFLPAVAPASQSGMAAPLPKPRPVRLTCRAKSPLRRLLSCKGI